MAEGERGPVAPEKLAVPALTLENLVTALREGDETGQAPPGERYRLNPHPDFWRKQRCGAIYLRVRECSHHC